MPAAMPTLLMVSDTPQHTIKTVCAQTGILPVTLRAWERRYKLLKPKRTSGNYRLYSDRDVALLRWVRGRMEAGMSISRVAAEFQALRRAGQWPEAMTHLPPAPLAQPGAPAASDARRLYDALTTMNEAQAGAILHAAQARCDLFAVCLEIVQPCLYEIGEAWARGALRIATEHFASHFLRGYLLTLFQACPMRQSAPRIVVGCAPNEYHDIGSLMVALFLRREGYRVEFIGANAHLEDLADYARAERPALICLSASSDEAARGLRQLDARLAGMRPRPRFAFGGRIFDAQPDLRSLVPGLFLGQDARQAVARVREFLPL
jgi:MerR family transcriptional regulator, light-induced transcriptional regulator